MRLAGILIALLLGFALMIATAPLLAYLRRRGVATETIFRTLVRGGFALMIAGAVVALVAMSLEPQPAIGPDYLTVYRGVSPTRVIGDIGGVAFFLGLGMLAMAKLLRDSK